ncbi:nucleotide pyrophosphatase [Arenibacter sp. N53]|uniref:alkaline phosphatase family protein n=1 Tax=Arenibacter TaxID=178469 RepID=UPI000CD46B47|nr:MULTISPECIES: alkaline phosphatase family protein [Arenibacter]MCM4152736.1 nucleotide pyrophosphatase [Arenibacter sp. N53]
MGKKYLFVVLTIMVLMAGCKVEDKTKEFNVLTKRVVVIGLDGISVDGYNTAKHPNLDALMADGVLSLNTRNVMPSVTLPNWTSHLTGSGPEQHGVLSNGWELDKVILPAVETDSEGYYPSIFKILKEGVPNVKTAFYYNWAELINSFNPRYLDVVSFEENDGYQNNYGRALDFIKRNKSNPTMVFLYSVHTDHAGHNHGWMSPEYITSIEEVDVHIGEFINKLKEEGLYEDTHFMFFTDHGGVPESGHGGITRQELEVPWAITGPGISKGRRLKEPNNSVNTAMTISHLFGCRNVPLSWTGEVPMSIFESNEK